MNQLAPTTYAYHTGRTIGRYKLLELLGSGGTAEVYRSVHPDLGREVAIKILYPSYTNDPGFVKRFRQEAQTVAGLMHPHIVQVYDFAVTEDGLYYIVMQYVNGISLDHFLGERETPLPLDRAYMLFCQIATALQFAHERGTIHRDLKPANILLDGRDHIYLTDFGFAKLVGVDLQTRSSMTLGTPVFMAPEQIENGPATAVTDVYALGAILYQMLTGHLPYEDSNVLALILRKIEDPPPPPQLFNPAIPDALAAL
ncbi:MAG TPA: serine/threonine-protein kinase, partial [Chloroflexota bacterium]|nr:serine/threonine-protein kinase [Chloroflexota bacterium]